MLLTPPSQLPTPDLTEITFYISSVNKLPSEAWKGSDALMINLWSLVMHTEGTVKKHKKRLRWLRLAVWEGGRPGLAAWAFQGSGGRSFGYSSSSSHSSASSRGSSSSMKRRQGEVGGRGL